MRYTFSNRLKIGSFIAMGVGFLFLALGFFNTPSSIEEAKEIVAAAHDDGHGGGHGEEASHGTEHEADYMESSGHKAGDDAHDMKKEHGDSHAESGHSAAHDEHAYHQLKNRPWSALYVAAFFFFMISLGCLLYTSPSPRDRG